MRKLMLGLWMTAVGCAPIEESEHPTTPSVQSSRGAIYGGTVANGDPEVFMLIMQFPDGSQGGCTATLIAPRSLLTAAHCVDPTLSGHNSMQIWAVNRTFANSATPGELIQVVETRKHPQWNPAVTGVEHDIAMARLASTPNAPVKAWNSASVNAFGGKPLRAVGYGRSSSSANSSGTKREVNLTFRQLTQQLIILGDQQGKGVCHGDSGGPSFHTFPDGVERVVGVHSFTLSEDCNDGADTRVDTYASFVSQWLGEKEAPTCAKDGRCKAGCTPVDQDCVCAADGTCNPQCLDLLDDPDCPRDCGANGICSTQPCPTPDADCVAIGGSCSKEEQCVSRVCVSDPQHAGFYCSRQCTQSTECPQGMECVPTAGICRYPQRPTKGPGEDCAQDINHCTGGTVCAGPVGGSTSCQAPCDKPMDCPLGSTCESGLGGVKYCHRPPAPTIVLKRASAEGQAPTGGCAAVDGAPLLFGLMALAGWGRRRRWPRPFTASQVRAAPQPR